MWHPRAHVDKPAFSLQRYAEMCAEAFGVPEADRVAIAARHGVNEETWERGLAEWTKRLDDDEDSPLSQEFRRLVLAALKRTVGPHAPLTLEAYVEINARSSAGHPIEAVLADHHTDGRAFSLDAFEWIVRADQDKRLNAYIYVRTQKRYAEITHQAPRSHFTVHERGNLVRARRCPTCGAIKASKPLTAYVYCDYCATCFDYDESVELRDDTALDIDRVDIVLGKAIADELVAAFRAGDREAYARAYTWQVEVSIETCPTAHSPRVKDPAYRRRFIDDVLVPWAVITTFDSQARANGQRCALARQTAVRTRTLQDILALYAISRAAWEHEATLFERDGLFARHPDGFDRAMYLRVNDSIFVRPWLAVLSDADQASLLAATGVACEYVSAPEVVFTPCGCGVCGRKLQVAAGAKRTVCEACGRVLEVGGRQFPCRQCGAPLSMPDGTTDDVVCGACNARWVR
jgi:hypothetical protein